MAVKGDDGKEIIEDKVIFKCTMLYSDCLVNIEGLPPSEKT